MALSDDQNFVMEATIMIEILSLMATLRDKGMPKGMARLTLKYAHRVMDEHDAYPDKSEEKLANELVGDLRVDIAAYIADVESKEHRA